VSPAFVACALALPFAFLPAAAAAQSAARFIPLAATVLKVEAPTNDGRMNVGSAVTVAPGVVVTSCHVTRKAVSVRLVKGGGRWPAAGQVADWNHDLCFLSVPSWHGASIKFASPTSLQLYAPVVAMGYTRGADLSMTPGMITGLHGYEGGHIIQTTSSFTSGASGGPLLDSEGRLIGVLTFRLRGNREHYFSVPAGWVQDRLPIAPDAFEPFERSDDRRAFWEGGCCVPHFMRVGELSGQAKWPELLDLALRWLAIDPEDAEAWLARGMAQARLGRPAEAVTALGRATRIAPRHAQAWYELAAASAVIGDAQAAGRAREALIALDSDLADRLPGAPSTTEDTAGGSAGARRH
jgi:serine protease Do